MLRVAHGSVPGNPLLAEPLYLTKYIKRMGTGTRDMIRRCQEVGLPEPDFAVSDGFETTLWRAGQVTGEVTGEVAKLLTRRGAGRCAAGQRAAAGLPPISRRLRSRCRKLQMFLRTGAIQTA